MIKTRSCTIYFSHEFQVIFVLLFLILLILLSNFIYIIYFFLVYICIFDWSVMLHGHNTSCCLFGYYSSLYTILWTRWVAVSSFCSHSHMLDRCRSLKDKFVWTGLSSLKDKFVWTWQRSVRFLNNKFIIGAHTIFISFFLFFFGFTSIIFVPTLTTECCSFSVLSLWFLTLGSSVYLFIFL